MKYQLTFLVVGLVGAAAASARAQVLLNDTIPSQSYYGAIEEIYQGDYRNAERAMYREARSPIRIGITDLWIDSICYQAVWGEVLYHQGRMAAAMDHFTEACNMFLQYPDWILRIDFQNDPRIDSNIARRVCPWGATSRQVTYSDAMDQFKIAFGDTLLQQQNTVQQGGVLRTQQYWRIDAIEIVRSLALAMSRRNEILGPLAKSDPLNRDLMNELVGGIAPLNHWSNAWSDLLLGIAYAGQGNYDLAIQKLQRGERLAGRFDYQLTAVSLLEQGRAALLSGKHDVADQLLAEATFSAYYYELPGIIDEAFRLAAMNRLGKPNWEPNPALDNAAGWAQRERYDHIYSRLCFVRSEELMEMGNWKQAGVILKTGQSKLARNQPGLLAVWSRYLEARILTNAAQPSASAILAEAIEGQISTSKSLYQLELANSWFDQQQIRASVAAEVYSELLADPAPADWALEPLDSLARLRVPLDPSFDRWIAAVTESRKYDEALRVTDLAKRHRFFLSLEMGGRVAALRKTLEKPGIELSPSEEILRDDLLRRFPQYSDLLNEGNRLYGDLRRKWQAGPTDDALRNFNDLLKKWSDNLVYRENILNQLSLGRVPCNFYFPPVLEVKQLQGYLAPGQAVVVFHETAQGMLGFLVTDRASTSWECLPPGRLAGLVSDFLKDLGNRDRNNSLEAEQLSEEEWTESGHKLFDALFKGSAIDPDSLDELIVVPDGIVWYVPIEALPVNLDTQKGALWTLARVRTVPTYGLSFGHSRPWRRIQHTSVVGNDIVPGDKEEVQAAAVEPLLAALPERIEFPTNSPVASPLMAALLDEVVVLDESEIDREDPLAWTPVPGRKDGEAGTLAAWMRLPEIAPQRMIFPGTHTSAENSGRSSRKRRDAYPPGSELFLTSCGLMSSGAQTILLARWRVGGQSTMDLMREFVQELPQTSAADAWQRCIEVAKVLPLKVSLEPRVKVNLEGETPTAAHPLFWAGYLLIDSGEPVDPAAAVAKAPEKPRP